MGIKKQSSFTTVTSVASNLKAFFDIRLNNIGTVYTDAKISFQSFIDNVMKLIFVSGPATAVNENVAVFDGTTGKIIKDSLLPLSNVQTKDLTTDYMWIGVANKTAEIPTKKVIEGNGTFISGVCSINDDDVTVNSIITTGMKTCSGFSIKGVYAATPPRIVFTSYTVAGAVDTADNGTFSYRINV